MRSDRYPNTPPVAPDQILHYTTMAEQSQQTADESPEEMTITLHRHPNKESLEEFNQRVDRAVEQLLYHNRDQRAANAIRRARTRRIRSGLYVVAMALGATAVVLMATTWLAPSASAQTFWQGFNQGLHLYYGMPYQPPQRPQATPVPRPAPLTNQPFRPRTPAMLPTEPEHNAAGYIPRSDNINVFTGTTALPGKSLEDEY